MLSSLRKCYFKKSCVSFIMFLVFIVFCLKLLAINQQSSKIDVKSKYFETESFRSLLAYATDPFKLNPSQSHITSSRSTPKDPSTAPVILSSSSISASNLNYLVISEIQRDAVAKFVSSKYFTNITKLPNKDLFDVISENYIPHSNWSCYEENTTAQSNLNFPYIISGEEICLKDVPYVLIIIPSVIGEIDRRDLMRKTWLRAAETNSWPREDILDKVKHIFFFGLHKNSRDEDIQFLMKESLLNNDIVMADFEDSYRNLTIKMLVSLKWTIKYCAQVTLVLKVDMDTFINVPLMMNLLYYVQKNVPSDKFIMGLKHSYEKPFVERGNNRWKVSQNEYPLLYYPKYVYGHTYVISINSISVLVSAAENKPIIAPEDAFITGILPKLAGVMRLNAPSFTVCCRLIFDCEIVWNTNVAITEIKSNRMLEKLWTNTVSRQCNYTHSIGMFWLE